MFSRLITFLLIFCCCALNAQQLASRFERFSLEQGLSQSVVNAILQDSQGFLWFGTGDGLNRFDGYHFKVFRHDPKNPYSISDNYVTTLHEDNQGQIWVGTRGRGLNRFDPKQQRFEHFIHNPLKADSLSHNSIRSFAQDKNGTIWIGTYGGGLNRYDKNQRRFIHYRNDKEDPNSLSDDKVLAIQNDPRGYLWLATSHGLNLFDIEKGQFKHYYHEPDNPASISANEIPSMLLDGDSLWLGTNQGLTRLNTQTGQVNIYKNRLNEPNSLSHNYINSVYKSRDGAIWLGTAGGGLNQLHLSNNTFTRHTFHGAQPHSISNDQVISIYQDRQGILWLGTFGGGVNKLDRSIEKFGHIKGHMNNSSSLSHDVVIALLQTNNDTLWVGTEHGLNRIDSKTGQFEHVFHDPNNPDSISSNRIWSLIEDQQKNLWVGTYGGGISRYNVQTKKAQRFMHDPANPKSLSDNRIRWMIQDSQGILWIASEGGGLNRLDPKGHDFDHFKRNPNNNNSLSSDNVFVVFEDAQKRLWIGTEGGLDLYNQKTKQFYAYRHDPRIPTSISYDFISTILQDPDGSLWVGTYGGGFNHFNPQTGRFTRYRESDGLGNDTINGLLQDRDGILWLSTNKGLTRFDPAAKSFTNFDVSDGLQSNEFNLGAYFINSRGELLFGGINGFNRFYPGAISLNSATTKTALTGLYLHNKAVPVSLAQKRPFSIAQAINHLPDLILNHKQNQMSFEFSALDYHQSAKLQYAYKLAGWDENWIYTNSENRRATYTNIPQGQYNLQIKASNADGIWSEQPTQLNITIKPAPWLTWQSLTLYLITFITSLYGLFRYRTRVIVERSLELEQRVRQRTETINQLMLQKDQMFANISHEFKTPLTLILNPLEALLQKSKDDQEPLSMIKRNAQRLLRMIEQLLELSKLDAGHIDKITHYSVNDVLNMLTQSFAPLLQQKQLTLNCDKFDDVTVPSPINALEIILSNLISNAIKYTNDHGQIGLLITTQTNAVTIQVKDNGIGISQTELEQVFNRFSRANENHGENIPGAGIGLALVKELVSRLNGQIDVTSELGQGSCFTLTLPTSKVEASQIENVNALSHTSALEIATIKNQPALAQTSPISENTNSEQLSVLLIDDNTDMLTLLVDTLSEQYHCLTAQDGTQGIALAESHLPDLIITDVMMPGISGHEVVKRIKQRSLTSHIPVIMLTAKGDIQSRLQAWTNNADDYLNKPFDATELVLRINNLLSLRKMLRQRYQQEFNNQPSTQFSQSTIAANDQDETNEFMAQIAGLDDANAKFIEKLTEMLQKHYKDESLNVAILAHLLGMSARNLGRKTKSILDLTPVEALRNFRLNKAAKLLCDGIPASQVSFDVGFSSHSYFTRCFKLYFNVTPSNYYESSMQQVN